MSSAALDVAFSLPTWTVADPREREEQVEQHNARRVTAKD
jgi:hypothetical protein